MIFKTEKYKIELQVDELYCENSSDNLNQYQKIYFVESEYVLPTKIGVKIFQNKVLIKSAIIGSIGGGTGIHSNSQIIEKDRILICCFTPLLVA